MTTLIKLVQSLDHVIAYGEAALNSNPNQLKPDANGVVGKLDTLVRDYYSTKCQLQIALRSKGSDLPHSDLPTVSQDFDSLNGSYSRQLARVYIIMNDSKKVLDYHLNIYKAIAESLQNSTTA